jgi:hypothetical protein
VQAPCEPDTVKPVDQHVAHPAGEARVHLGVPLRGASRRAPPQRVACLLDARAHVRRTRRDPDERDPLGPVDVIERRPEHLEAVIPRQQEPLQPDVVV